MEREQQIDFETCIKVYYSSFIETHNCEILITKPNAYNNDSNSSHICVVFNFTIVVQRHLCVVLECLTLRRLCACIPSYKENPQKTDIFKH